MRVYQLNKKPETPGERGIPKVLTPEAAISVEGLVGDFNRYRSEKRDGDLRQAVLIYTWEMLSQLRKEGWPVEAGELGENMTLIDTPYSQLQPGTVLRVGSAELLITKPANPCANLGVLPCAGGRVEEFIKTLEGRRGWYASVQRPGYVHIGDEVFLD